MKARFLQQNVCLVEANAIPPDLIINLDETGIKLVPVGDWSMTLHGSKRVDELVLVIKDELPLHLLILLVEYFSRYSCFIREKPIVTMQNLLSKWFPHRRCTSTFRRK